MPRPTASDAESTASPNQPQPGRSIPAVTKDATKNRCPTKKAREPGDEALRRGAEQHDVTDEAEHERGQEPSTGCRVAGSRERRHGQQGEHRGAGLVITFDVTPVAHDRPEVGGHDGGSQQRCQADRQGLAH
jgi:hypothetical protein